MDPSRSTVWRSSKRKLETLREQCSCLYHQAAQNDDDDDSCSCEFHTRAMSDSSDTESDCGCEIHLQAGSKLSDLREKSKPYRHTAVPNVMIFDFGASPADSADSVVEIDYENKESSTRDVFLRPGSDDNSISSSCSDCGKYGNSNISSRSSQTESSVENDNENKESSTTRVFLRPDPDDSNNSSSSDSREDLESNGSSGDDALQQPPLEEMPYHGESSDDPDDPDDPQDSGDFDDDNNENDHNASDSDPDADLPPGTRILTFENASLNTPLQMQTDLTSREAVAMVLSLADRDNLNYEMMIKILVIIDTILGNSPLPVTKEQLWSTLNKHAAGIRKHAYCSRCFTALGFVHLLRNPVECVCGWTKPKGKVKYFITLNIRAQLERLLNYPGIWDELQYPQQRRKVAPDTIEDILDGEAYRRLRAAENGLSPSDFTYNFNLDGFKISDSSKTEAWPIFLKINELPPNLRQKHVILAGLWVDQDYVHFNLFMRTFVKQANKLATTGVTWLHNGEVEVSRFVCCCCVADAKGRAGILRMSTYTGNYGCTFCEHHGVKLEGSMKFPIPGTVVNRVCRLRGQDYVEQIVIQPAELRTDQSIRHLMAMGRRMRGVIGPAQVMLLSHFDLAIGCSTDDLHPVYKGVAEFHTELLLEGVPNVYAVGVNDRALINQRLREILTPTHISRKPRAVDQRHMWKASEWRNWLLFYGVLCLWGIVPDRYVRHFGLLSKAVFLLTRDVISQLNLQEAERVLTEYVSQFQELFGPQNMRFNVHILTHLVQCVRNWGPLWAHSTFPFESWNHRLAKKMSSPKGAIDQICMRYLMHSLIVSIPDSEQISENVKDVIEMKIIGSKMKDIQIVDGAYFFGTVIERDATDVELALLAENGYENYNLNTEDELKLKIRDDEGNLKRYGTPKRLSMGPLEMDLESSEELQEAKKERVLEKASQKITTDCEFEEILSTNSTKVKNEKKKKKKTEHDLAAAKTDDWEIMLKVMSTPENRNQFTPEISPKKTKEVKKKKKKTEHDPAATKKPAKRGNHENIFDVTSYEKSVPHDRDHFSPVILQKKTKEVEVTSTKMKHDVTTEGEEEEPESKRTNFGEVSNNAYVSCGDPLCESQLNMALATINSMTERYAGLEESVRSMKADIKELKTLILSLPSKVTENKKPQKQETCNFRNLKDVNPKSIVDYTVPEGMVPVGGGHVISLIDVAKVEKLEDLRGRLAGLCHLYWPHEEIDKWSLSGKKGNHNVNKITSDYTAGMAEILKSMKWKRKANLSDENVHRTLSRVLSELTVKKRKEEETVKEKPNDRGPVNSSSSDSGSGDDE